MRTTKANEIADLENNELVMHMQGTLTKVWDYKEGDNDKGHWSFQNAEFKDESGTVKVKLVNQPDRQNLANKPIYIAAHKGDKGYTGVYAFDDSYTNKQGKTVETRLVKITATGQIELDDRTKVERREEDSAEASSPGNGVKLAKQAAFQASEAMNIALRAAHYTKSMFELENKGLKITPEHLQAMTSSIFIFLDRHNLVEKLPRAPIDPPDKEEPLVGDDDF